MCGRDFISPFIYFNKGCKCAQGYYRNFDGRCVDELTCAFCGYNEDWYEPPNSFFWEDAKGKILSRISYCPEEVSCEDILSVYPNQTTNIPPVSFNQKTNQYSCHVGYCYCTEGTVRTNSGHCVNEKSCLRCLPNEVYEECGSSSCWELTCNQSQWTLEERNQRACTLDCRSGCKCLLGYYRKQLGDVCVRADDCLEDS
jgi:hypothetical protein